MYKAGEYKRVIANGKHPVLIGSPDFSKISIFGLKPGDKITRIGNNGIRGGKSSSSSRVMSFNVPVIYLGIIKIDSENFMAFENNETPVTIYMLFAFIEEFNELILQFYNHGSILIYKAMFQKVGTIS